jgi:ComF family protein
MLDWLYAPACAGCDVRWDGPFCEVCAVSVDEAVAGPAVAGLERLVAPYGYGGQLAEAVRRLKFGRRAEVARALAPLLAPALAEAAEGCDLVMPVPLHWRRLAGRGFNQAWLLLKHAGAGVDVVADRLSLRRVRATPPQTGLDAVGRRRNVAGAFAVPARRAARVAGRRILLVDDVVTTGATMAAAAAALRAAGATEVVGLCVARAEIG